MRRISRLTFMVLLSVLLATAIGGSASAIPMPEKNIVLTAPKTSGLPPYIAIIRPVAIDRLGASWRPGCPVEPGNLRLIDLSTIDFSGQVVRGELIVAEDVATEVAYILADLYFDRYPIERMHTIERYGGNDDASMIANNTSAFNCRPITGGTEWSNHSYGRAIDINPVQNPYISSGGKVYPPNGAPYVNRAQSAPGLIHAESAVVRAFEKRGWEWGGRWSTPLDYQHFEKETG